MTDHRLRLTPKRLCGCAYCQRRWTVRDWALWWRYSRMG